jgi:hypothetical protein
MKSRSMRSVARLALPFVVVVLHLGFLFGCTEESAHPEAQSAPAPADNAAEEYRSLHAAMASALIAQLKQAGGALTPELERHLPAAQPVIDRLVWATRLEWCDWEIDYSAGYDTDLPHLSKLRDLALLLRADARRAMHAGDEDTAAEDVAAIVRMSRHVGGKGPIEAMVAFAMLFTAGDLTTEYAGSWNKSQRRTVRLEFQQIDRRDPFGGDAMLEWDNQLAARTGTPGPDEEWFRSAQQKAVDRLARAIEALK